MLPSRNGLAKTRTTRTATTTTVTGVSMSWTTNGSYNGTASTTTTTATNGSRANSNDAKAGKTTNGATTQTVNCTEVGHSKITFPYGRAAAVPSTSFASQ